MATGARARWLGLPEELDFRTKIGGVSACATCDGFFYKSKNVLVVGGGDTAMEEATFLTKFADKVTVVHRRDTLRASKIMQDRAFSSPKIAWMWDSVIEKILGGPGQGVKGALVRNLKTGDTQEVAAGGIFMAIGHEPNTVLFRGVLDMDDAGYLLTRRHAGHQRRRRARSGRRGGPPLPPGGGGRRHRLHGRHRRGALPVRALRANRGPPPSAARRPRLAGPRSASSSSLPSRSSRCAGRRWRSWPWPGPSPVSATASSCSRIRRASP